MNNVADISSSTSNTKSQQYIITILVYCLINNSISYFLTKVFKYASGLDIISAVYNGFIVLMFVFVYVNLLGL